MSAKSVQVCCQLGRGAGIGLILARGTSIVPRLAGPGMAPAAAGRNRMEDRLPVRPMRWHIGCKFRPTMSGPEDVGRGSPSVTQPLREDYVALEPVLRGVTTLADRVRGGQASHTLLLVGALTCLDSFQRRHDQKVEGVLLPVLSARDASLGADVAGDVIRAHREGRRRVAELQRSVAGSRLLNAAMCQLAVECVASLRAHAVSELDGLFARADRVLSVEDAVPLWNGFRQVDERASRPGEQRALRALADAIDPRRPARGGIETVADVVAAHVMRPWPRTVRPADTLARAAEVMDQSNVRELPVVEDGRLRGIVSRGDLQAHAGHLEWTRVEAAMTPQPVVVTPEQSVGAVSHVLIGGRFNAVPVIADETDTTLIGMISRSDLLRAVADHGSGDGR
jgi:CBS domain-containing protein